VRAIDRSRAESRAIARTLLAARPSPTRPASGRTHQLSGGQLQRAMIALALAATPTVIADSRPPPRPETQARILTLLRRLSDGGRA
jgi:ABC-type glutathione transport system ATPase component